MFQIECRFPFDWKTPIGYFVAIILQHIISAISFTVVACALSYAIGGCLIAFSMLKEIRRILSKINRNAKSSRNDQRTVHHLTRTYIQLHSDLKQLSARQTKASTTKEKRVYSSF